MRKPKKKPISLVQMILTLLAVVCLLISNIITAKQVLLPFGITMTGAVVIFPITYILSDLFSEVYGYKWSRLVCYLSFLANLFMVIVFSLVIITPTPDYWTNQEAFMTVLGSTPRVLIASFLAFIIGGLVDDLVFKKLKDRHPNDMKGFGFRAILSSLFGELVDSLIFLPIAFLGQMPLETLAVMTVLQVLIKTGYEIITLPITRIAVKKTLEYEKRNELNKYKELVR